MGNRLFYGISVKQIPVGDHHRLVYNTFFSKVGADDVNDLLIKKRFTAKPVQMNLFAAAMRCNISRCLVGGFVAHGNTGTPHLIAVKAPGIAVCSGKDGISGYMLRFFLHRAADKTHLVGIFLVLHLLRYAKPAAAQFSHCVWCGILLCCEQKQCPCEGMEHQHSALDRLGKNVCHPAKSLLCRLWLPKDLHCVARRRKNSLHIVLLLLIHPMVSHKCSFWFHVTSQLVQRHAAAQ